MKYFDKESKKQCVLLKDQDVENKIQHMGIVILVKKESILDKNINVLIRELDTKESEEIAMKDAAKEYWEQIDSNARNYFYRGVGARTLKCMLGYNHHGKWNCMVNKGLTSSLCLRCNEQED